MRSWHLLQVRLLLPVTTVTVMVARTRLRIARRISAALISLRRVR